MVTATAGVMMVERKRSFAKGGEREVVQPPHEVVGCLIVM
jgi:hypothetical protein